MELEISPPDSMACDSACSGNGFIPAVPLVKRKRTTRRRIPPAPAAALALDISSNAAPAEAAPAASVCVTEEEADMANCLILLAQGRGLIAGGEAGVYECTSCNKSFPSFQALGGHRAGHKKPKPAMTDEEALIGNNASGSPRAKMHECAVCGSGFSSGQALGGHMRRHRAPAAASSGCRGIAKQRSFFSPDLNLPAPADDEDQEEEEQLGRPTSPSFTFIVGATTLVDCHY